MPCPYCGRKEEDMRGNIAANRGRRQTLGEVIRLVEELRDHALHQSDLFEGVKKIGLKHEVTAYANIIRLLKKIIDDS